MPDKIPFSDRLAILRAQFVRFYGASPELTVRAPGRVNLIGEHTDYNDGYVLPIAIDRSVLVASSARTDQTVRLWAVDLNAHVTFSLDDIVHARAQRWSNYQRGVAVVLNERLSRATCPLRPGSPHRRRSKSRLRSPGRRWSDSRCLALSWHCSASVLRTALWA